MSAEIIILTPDPEDEAFGSRWREVLECHTALLRNCGRTVAARSWVDAGNMAGAALVLPLLVWGYHRDPRRWADSLAAWERDGVRLLNPPPVLRWNADKSYLGRLAQRGAPVVPTLYRRRIDQPAMEEAAIFFGSDQLVAKPRVSASAWETIRWSPGEALDGAPSGEAMIQPFLPAIEREGEISLIFFGGRFSHAISKRPQPGDFRVQPEFDGIISAHEPAPDELAAASAILDAVDERLLYARIDLVRGPDGRPALMEIELVEPDLYLAHGAGAGPAFADAVAAAAVQRFTCR